MTKPRTIGGLTIGEAPRADDAVTELLQVLGDLALRGGVGRG
jgi:hypothetical protein